MKILVTGASGMLGRYLLPLIESGNEVVTLQRHDADIVCDLAAEVPDLGGRRFDLVVHMAGTSDETGAFPLNFDGTNRLLSALESNPPRQIIYLSSWEVYSPDSGENVEETHQTWASTDVGKSKARAEDALAAWTAGRGVMLTVVRPARMMGKGVKGEMGRLFSDVTANRYIHVRDNAARLSLVCASDVAQAIKNLDSIGGIFNVADDRGATWIELADAMSANSGAMKRQTYLPEKWAQTAWRFASWIPAVKASLSPETLARRSKTLTLSNAALHAALPGWTPFATVDVISRTAVGYKYVDN